MEGQIKSPDLVRGQPGFENHLRCDHTTKIASVLRIFIERGEVGLNCFEGARLGHDYVLRSTISELQRLHGVTFRKRWETVPGFGDSTVRCVRYSLDAAGHVRATAILGGDAGLEARAA